jgi:hypothetical protein
MGYPKYIGKNVVGKRLWPKANALPRMVHRGGSGLELCDDGIVAICGKP